MNLFFKSVPYSSEIGFRDRLSALLRTTKVIHLTDVGVDQDLREFYTALTDRLGEIVPADEDARSGDRKTERWTDIRFDQAQAQQFRHSATQQPLHTDTAYTSYDNDVNFFFCEVRSELGGATTFIDGDQLERIMQDHEPQLLARLSATEVAFGKGSTERKLKKVFDRDSEGVLLNWNWFRVDRERNAPDVLAMCDEFHRFLEERIVKAGLLKGVILEPGECVFFQDRRVLHGRNAFFGDRVLIKGALNFHKAAAGAPR